jgi:hypothetical protein
MEHPGGLAKSAGNHMPLRAGALVKNGTSPPVHARPVPVHPVAA